MGLLEHWEALGWTFSDMPASMGKHERRLTVKLNICFELEHKTSKMENDFSLFGRRLLETLASA